MNWKQDSQFNDMSLLAFLRLNGIGLYMELSSFSVLWDRHLVQAL